MVDDSRCDAIEALLLEAPPDALDAELLPPHVADCPRCSVLLEQVRADHAAVVRAIAEFSNADGFDDAFAAVIAQADGQNGEDGPTGEEGANDLPRPVPRVEAPIAGARPPFVVGWAIAASVGLLVALGVVIVLWAQSFPTELEPFATDAATDAAAPVVDTGHPVNDRKSGDADVELDPSRWARDGVPFVELETDAILGLLTPDVQEALEAVLQDERTSMTHRSKISRLLMVDAFSKGDKERWAKLIQRHLEEIEQSDPDLAYKYALHLSHQPDEASGQLRWAQVALENRSVWTGSTYEARVYSLHKLRADAAQKLWQQTEVAVAASPDDADLQVQALEARKRTAALAREWFEVSQVLDRDTETALALCRSAATDPEYCGVNGVTGVTGGVFEDIEVVLVRSIAERGLIEVPLGPDESKQIEACLYQTREIPEEEAAREYLASTYLLEVRDRSGTHSFELYTPENLKGNKGRHYANGCLLQLLLAAQ